MYVINQESFWAFEKSEVIKLKEETQGKKRKLLANSYLKTKGVHKTQAGVLNS